MQVRGTTQAGRSETAVLRELLSRRRMGRSISAQEMDKRLDAMIAEKRRAHVITR